MDYSNWQFWLVTFIFIVALLILIKPLFAKAKKKNCGCATSSNKKKIDLTVDGK